MRRARAREANDRDTIDVKVERDPQAKTFELTIAWLTEMVRADGLMARPALTVPVQTAVRP